MTSPHVLTHNSKCYITSKGVKLIFGCSDNQWASIRKHIQPSQEEGVPQKPHHYEASTISYLHKSFVDSFQADVPCIGTYVFREAPELIWNDEVSNLFHDLLRKGILLSASPYGEIASPYRMLRSQKLEHINAGTTSFPVYTLLGIEPDFEDPSFQDEYRKVKKTCWGYALENLSECSSCAVFKQCIFQRNQSLHNIAQSLEEKENLLEERLQKQKALLKEKKNLEHMEAQILRLEENISKVIQNDENPNFSKPTHYYDTSQDIPF